MFDHLSTTTDNKGSKHWEEKLGLPKHYTYAILFHTRVCIGSCLQTVESYLTDILQPIRGLAACVRQWVKAPGLQSFETLHRAACRVDVVGWDATR